MIQNTSWVWFIISLLKYLTEYLRCEIVYLWHLFVKVWSLYILVVYFLFCCNEHISGKLPSNEPILASSNTLMWKWTWKQVGSWQFYGSLFTSAAHPSRVGERASSLPWGSGWMYCTGYFTGILFLIPISIICGQRHKIYNCMCNMLVLPTE